MHTPIQRLHLLGRMCRKGKSMKEKMYYVEINMEDVDVENYLAQSQWFKTEKECIEWANKLFDFFFSSFDYQAFTDLIIMEIMSSECEFDDEDYFEYGDIDSEYRLFYDYDKHKVVSEEEFKKPQKRLPF